MNAPEPHLPQVEIHSTREAASQAAADGLAAAVAAMLDSAARATLVVSGGTTPKLCFEALAKVALPWSRVAVTLSDERLVAADHTDSNERLVRRSLLERQTPSATFHPLNDALLTNVSTPFAAVLLGMGEDGHFASIFPDSADLSTALDLASAVNLLSVKTQASPLPRITMTLPLLCRSEQIILLAFGETKRRLIESPKGLPIAALLQQTQTPVRVIWAA